MVIKSKIFIKCNAKEFDCWDVWTFELLCDRCLWRVSATQVRVWLSRLLVFWVCSARQIFYVYHNPNLVDCIDDCLLTAMATVQTEEVRASFMFVGDLNGHHPE